MADPLVSVVITSFTLDRLPDVYSVLDGLRRQHYRNLEVLFVGERDRAIGEAVREYAARAPALAVEVLWNGGSPGLSQARNVAIPLARGEVIAFLDDDVVPAPEWAGAIAAAFDDPEVIGVTGPAFPLWDEPSMDWFPEELSWIISCTTWTGWQARRRVRNAWGMNMAFRAEGFAQAGGFAEETGYHIGALAEDDEFSFRLRSKTGRSIVFEPGAVVLHHVHRYRLSVRFIRERSAWIGRSRRSIKQLYHEQPDTDLREEYSLLQRILWRFAREVVRLPLSPARSARRMGAIAWSLLWVAVGYLAPGGAAK